jgi:uncharacterized protein
MPKIHIPELMIELKPSKMLTGEIGVTAIRDLEKNTIVEITSYFDDDSEYISWSDFNLLDEKTKNKATEFCLGTEEGIYMHKNLNRLSVPWYMNHSCNYNVGFDNTGNFITIRNIKSGEELCWDYGLGESNPNFRMICKCGSKVCRRVITGNDWKDETFRKNNVHFLYPELKNNK